MIIRITYRFPIARDFWAEDTMTADTFEEADEICEAILRNGFEILNVTREEAI